MKRIIIIISVLIFCSVFCLTSGAQQRDVIQMAILLDTSNSMDGLIDQTKASLWKIVNELARGKRNNNMPRIEVALFEYGKDSIPEGEGHIRLIVPLTADLDQVSEELFRLTTNGGDEFCGKVIGSAVHSLQWDRSKNVYKVIFIAGNEPFTQGDVNYRNTCREAAKTGIIVNTIYCGSFQEGVQTGWKDGADLADGSYMNIDQNRQIADIRAPQDEEILKLNGELNATYIAYGSSGQEKKERQAAQDANSASMANESAVQRAMAKSAPVYSNESWDLVDRAKQDSSIIEKLKDEELSPEMKKMNKEERLVFVEKKRKERDAIQTRIQKLSEERRVYVEKEMKKNAENSTLDDVVIGAVRTQAMKKGYSFGK